jgi:hypothetical protein
VQAEGCWEGDRSCGRPRWPALLRSRSVGCAAVGIAARTGAMIAGTGAMIAGTGASSISRAIRSRSGGAAVSEALLEPRARVGEVTASGPRQLCRDAVAGVPGAIVSAPDGIGIRGTRRSESRIRVCAAWPVQPGGVLGLDLPRRAS